MQARFLIAATLIVLFALTSARWSWVEEDDAPAHHTLRPPGKSGDFEADTPHYTLRPPGKSGDFEADAPAHYTLRPPGKSGDFGSTTLDVPTHHTLRPPGKSGDFESDAPHYTLRPPGKSGDMEADAHYTLRPPGKSGDFETNTLGMQDFLRMSHAEEGAQVLQQQGSLSANHQEAKDADELLNALIKRLTQQIADDSAATNQKISDRTNSIKKFDDAVNAAKAYLDDLTNQQTALNKKLDEAKTALAGRQGEKTAEQANIDKENAEQRARLADRIAAVEKQIALIKQILILLSGQAPNPQTPSDSIILDTDGEAAVSALLKGTKYEGKKFQRLFVASQNGYEGAKYIAACRDKPALLTIIKSTNGNVFGGFNSFALDGSWTWKVDPDAFIFSYKRGSETKMVKMNPTPNNDNRVSYLGHVSFGPVFGADDLFTADRCNANTNSLSMLGRAFQSPDGKVVSPNNVVLSSYITGVERWQCAEYEVYQLV